MLRRATAVRQARRATVVGLARRATAVGLVVVLAAASAACSSDEDERAEAAARKFLDAWSAGNFSGAGAATDAPDGPREWLPAVQKQLGAVRVKLKAGTGSVDGDRATREFTVSWQLPGQPKPWSYRSKLDLTQRSDGWTVHWDPRLIHPDLRSTLRLRATRVLPERAALLDRSGQPIFTKVPVVTVGVEPRLVTDLPALAATLASTLDVNAGEIVADVRKAKPTQFVPVVTLRRQQYLQVKPKIHSLPGTVFQDGEKLLARSATFGQPLLGRVGEATAEVLREAGATYAPGDVLGTSGLQRALNKQLAGVPEVKISLVDSAGKRLKELATFAGEPGEAVRTTLDQGIQAAAEAALTPVRQQASIVAIKPSTGEVLAVANSTGVGFDIALEGRYPPGSTFKIVTAAALLQAGTVRPNSPVPCPGSLVVGGKTFINADRFALGTVPLRTAFARSCNTTFTSLASKLPGRALTEAASQFGVGSDWKLPVAVYEGAVPPPKDTTEQAADAIGQGKVLMSPFGMAVVAATLQRGSIPTPTLVAGAPAEPGASAGAALPANVAGPLRDFARAVVTEGTGTALAGLPGQVAGKTGTAEYGDARPPRSHSWFAGYRGDLAFAVFVYDGASSNQIATPLAGRFLSGVR